MNFIYNAFKTIRIIITWGLIIPLVYLFPLKKNLVLFMGKSKGLFFDNVKYIYLYLHRLQQNEIQYYFFTRNKSVYETLKQHHLPVLLHPTLRSIYALVCANVIIMCCTWHKRISFRAKKIQLWHGIPLKRIGLLVPKVAKAHNSSLGSINDAIRGRNYIYNLFVSTSEYFTKNIFSKAMRARNYIESGYPRNDIFFKEQLDELDLLETDIESLQKITEFRNKGFKAILYAPTWDDPMGNAIKSGFLNLERLSAFAKKHKILFVSKFHPMEHCDTEYGLFDNIIHYHGIKDIQPLLRITDILITDYSSVYMDYLLLDRPVIFFPYNYEKYMNSQSGLIFDYKSVTPGPICYSQDQLQETLKNYSIGQSDEFAEKRKELKKLAFKYEDGKSSERIWNFIKTEFLKNS